MKQLFCSACGITLSFIASLFGGWDSSIITLMIFMVIDYITGMIVGGVFHKSNKTESGNLESRAGWKGICKKFITLLFIILANRLDIQLGTTYIRDFVCITFISNELLSIVENAGLMGIPIPQPIKKAIAVLHNNVKD